MDKVILFSGQGPQAPGMFKNYYDEYECVREVFSLANKVLGRDITDLIFNGTQEELNKTINTQPAMLSVDLAASAILKYKKINVIAVAGFCLGEYAALVEAGCIDIETSFKLIDVRAHAMDDAFPKNAGGMLAVSKLSEEQVQDIILESKRITNKYAVIVTYTSPTQFVVSGEIEVLEKIKEFAKGNGGRAAMLLVSGPFHSKFMEPAYKELEKEFNKISFKDAKIPIYMNVDGKSHINGNEIKKLALNQTISPVKWNQTMKNLINDGYNDFVECGYGNVLTKLMKRTYENVIVTNFE